MPKLLQINSVINSGSTGRIAEGIGKAAIKNGWQSYVAYARNSNESESELIKIEKDWDIKCHGIQTRLFDRHGLASVGATKGLVEKIKVLKPDIIHLHNLHGYYINIKILFEYLASANIPVVWTLHDCWPITGHCAYFSFIGCHKWKIQCEHCPQINVYPSSFGLDRSYKNYNLKKKLFTSVSRVILVPVSNWLDNIIEDSFLKIYPRKVIYNGIDTNTFKPMQNGELRSKLGLKDKHILLGVANIWNYRKGLEDFIELAKLLNDDEMIVLVGLNKRQIEKVSCKAILGLGKTESTKQLAELYSFADVFINPTWEDNFPTTNIEALACGTPVITYRTGGSPEALSRETGFIVEQGDVAGIRGAVNAIRSRGKPAYLSACRERAIRMFNKDNQYEQYIQLYEELLASR
jgi:glycosyltransferase involved in cell wall biosynthesis